MVQISVKHNLKKLQRQLKADQKQVRFAAAKTLTQVAVETVKFDAKREMKRVFDRPIRYTLNSLRWKRATKANLVAVVRVKDRLDAGKGTSPENYLTPQISGGRRKLKRFERALQKRGILPRGMYAVPGSGADIDMHGNMSKGQIVQILSYFSAFGEQGYRANSTAKTRSRIARGTKAKRGFAYFAIGPGHGLHPGIYKRIGFGFGSAIKAVLIFVRAPRYRRRFDLGHVVSRVVSRDFDRLFERNYKHALATAK